MVNRLVYAVCMRWENQACEFDCKHHQFISYTIQKSLKFTTTFMLYWSVLLHVQKMFWCFSVKTNDDDYDNVYTQKKKLFLFRQTQKRTYTHTHNPSISLIFMALTIYHSWWHSLLTIEFLLVLLFSYAFFFIPSLLHVLPLWTHRYQDSWMRLRFKLKNDRFLITIFFFCFCFEYFQHLLRFDWILAAEILRAYFLLCFLLFFLIFFCVYRWHWGVEHRTRENLYGEMAFGRRIIIFIIVALWMIVHTVSNVC